MSPFIRHLLLRRSASLGAIIGVPRPLSGAAGRLDHECVVALDNVVTIPANLLGRTVGYLSAEQESALARTIVLAYDLELPLLD